MRPGTQWLCSAEVHILEGLLVLIDGAPGSVVLFLLGFLSGLLAGSKPFIHWRRDIQVLAGLVGLRSGFAFVAASHFVLITVTLPVPDGRRWR